MATGDYARYISSWCFRYGYGPTPVHHSWKDVRVLRVVWAQPRMVWRMSRIEDPIEIAVGETDFLKTSEANF